jgi:hypothetical protein
LPNRKVKLFLEIFTKFSIHKLEKATESRKACRGVAQGTNPIRIMTSHSGHDAAMKSVLGFEETKIGVESETQCSNFPQVTTSIMYIMYSFFAHIYF